MLSELCDRRNVRGSRSVIRLISISSPVELFIRRKLDVFCMVRRYDQQTVELFIHNRQQHRVLNL